MLVGARIVLFVVLQESRITASAAVPPTPQSSFSRLPWIHRVSLECHTKTECRQKLNVPTTHFYGKYPSDFAQTYRFSSAVLCFAFAARYSIGDLADSFLNTRLNCESD